MKDDIRLLTHQRKLFFDNLVAKAEFYKEKGKIENALILLNIASEYAYYRHFGDFYSEKIENMLSEISRSSMPDISKKYSYNGFKSVLHIATEFSSVGGHTRLFLNWIKYDIVRSHSIVITNQMSSDLPENVVNISSNYCDKLLCLLDSEIKFLDRAKILRKFAEEYDLIVLHIHPQDIVPSIALTDFKIPIIFVNHSDHSFWIGRNILSFISEFRNHGKKITNDKRNISERYQYILPIPLEKPILRDRKEARRILGFNHDDFVLFSVASSHKYKEMNGGSIEIVLMPLIAKYENLKVVVVGPSSEEKFWKELNKKSNDRIKALGIISDVTNYYISSDIYLDSYPTSSLTSLLDAGKYGLPFFSLLNGEFQLDDPSLTGFNFSYKNPLDLIDVISEMINNPKLRKEYALECQRKINSNHLDFGWLAHLNNLYEALKISSLEEDTKNFKILKKNESDPDLALMLMYPKFKAMEVEYVYFFRSKINLFFEFKNITALIIIIKSLIIEPKTTLKLIIPKKIIIYYMKLFRRIK